MKEWKTYVRVGEAEMLEVTDSLIMDSSFPWPAVSVSDADERNGSPKVGDMIARNPNDHSDMWLVARDYFRDNFTEA